MESTSTYACILGTLMRPITSMIVPALWCQSLVKYMEALKGQLSLQLQRLAQRSKQLSATTGTWVSARIPAKIAASMVSVASAVHSIEPKTPDHATVPSKLDWEKELGRAVKKSAEEAALGPKTFSSPSFARPMTTPLDVPKYCRGFIWSSSRPDHESPAALATETAPPLPSPPLHLLQDSKIKASLDALAGHIRMDTPFNIYRFSNLLLDHLNRPFVDSVIRGLREGFWPFEDGDWDPKIEDIPKNFATGEIDLETIRAHRDKELAAGRWSDPLPFDSLLHGMKLSPMFVVWQKEKPRVITDHSSSGLNDGIPRADAKVRYNDMRSFGQVLFNARMRHPSRKILSWKSDVSSAFFNLPAHPLWQMRQVIMIDGKLYIVRCLVFGNRASPRIWCSVSALLCWIAIRKLDVEGLHVYMDDFYSWDFADHLILFHGRPRPPRQIQLLVFWDYICCPYEDKKQDHGDLFKIIGFWVDAMGGSISLSPESISELIDHVDDFLKTEDRKPHLRS